MKCFLLAAGLGTRLRPITDHTPKCLVKIQDTPLLEYWISALHAAGVTDFLINTHYLPEQVRKFVADHPLRKHIQLVHEEKLLGTGGTIAANRAFFESGTTLLAHADNLCVCSWRDFFSAHVGRPAECPMTMMTFRAANPSDCGIVELNECGVVNGFHEKVASPPGNLANAAVYLMEPSILNEMDSIPEFSDLSTQLVPALKGRIFTWENKNVLIDIGSPERLQSAQTRMAAAHAGKV